MTRTEKHALLRQTVEMRGTLDGVLEARSTVLEHLWANRECVSRAERRDLLASLATTGRALAEWFTLTLVPA